MANGNNNNDVSHFQKRLSLENKCGELAGELVQKLHNSLQERRNPINFLVGLHIRHVLDTNAPSVAVCLSKKEQKKEVDKIQKKNKAAGLQTLNHVLDTLYYNQNRSSDSFEHTSTSREGVQRRLVWVDFLCPDNSECHQFDRNATYNNKKLKPDDSKPGKTCEWKKYAYFVKKKAFSDEHIDKVAEFASGKPSMLDNPKSENKTLFTDYICGAEKFCKDFEIDHSLSAYRVITAAIYQLGRYACKDKASCGQKERFGGCTLTAFIRSDSAFGLVLGATLIINKAEQEQQQQHIEEAICNFLDDKWRELVENRFHLPTGRLFEADNKIWHDVEEAIWGQDWIQTPSVEHLITKHLRAAILEDNLSGSKNSIREKRRVPVTSQERQWKNWSRVTMSAINAFLQTLRSYAGERLEGRYLSFGFILGNPGLLTHTPREQPFPITYARKEGGQRSFFTRAELIKQVHLVSAPEERAVVIPYCRCENAGPEGKIAAHILEFDEAMEEFRARPWSALWRDMFVPYLYYTERFPWAVAGFVGPGAEIRVFVDAEIAAYHDEKGWWDIRVDELVYDVCEEVLRSPCKGEQEEIMLIYKKMLDSYIGQATKPEHEEIALFYKEMLACIDQEKVPEQEEEREKQRVLLHKTIRAFVNVALQMSRFTNSDAKGGMLVWLNSQYSNDNWYTKKKHPKIEGLMEDLNTHEPLRYDQTPWLRGKSLISDAGDLDYSVAKLVLQAAKQDGAIIIKREEKVSRYEEGVDMEDKEKMPRKVPNAIIAFGQRITVKLDSDSDAPDGTRRAAAQALMIGEKQQVCNGSIAIAISSDGPLRFWVKRGDEVPPAEYTLGDYREWY